MRKKDRCQNFYYHAALPVCLCWSFSLVNNGRCTTSWQQTKRNNRGVSRNMLYFYNVLPSGEHRFETLIRSCLALDSHLMFMEAWQPLVIWWHSTVVVRVDVKDVPTNQLCYSQQHEWSARLCTHLYCLQQRFTSFADIQTILHAHEYNTSSSTV